MRAFKYVWLTMTPSGCRSAFRVGFITFDPITGATFPVCQVGLSQSTSVTKALICCSSATSASRDTIL